GEHKFTSADPKLALSVKPAAQVARENTEKPKAAATRAAEKVQPDAAKVAGQVSQGQPAVPQSDSGARQSARAVTSNLIKNLEAMVEEARTQSPEHEETVTARPDAATVPSGSAGSVKSVNLSPSARALPGEAVERKTIPVPITFVFNEANFTDE